MFSAVIFDMDGLLLDSERCLMQAWLAASRDAGVPLAAQDFMYTVGRNAAESREKLIDLLGGEARYVAVHERVCARLGPENERIFPLKPGALELLAALAAKRVPCALASSTYSAESAGGWRPLMCCIFSRRLSAVMKLPEASLIRRSMNWPPGAST